MRLLQPDAVEILHGDEVLPLVNLENHADVGMVQRRSCLRLSLGAGQRLGVFGYFIGQGLQGHEAMQLYILSLIDNTHAATAELLDDGVVAGWSGRSWRSGLQC